MVFTDMSIDNFINGLVTLIWVITTTVIGTRIIQKTRKLKKNEYITVGMTMLLLSSPWWGVATEFITHGFFNYHLTEAQYLLIANVALPFWMVGLVYCIVTFMELKRGKLILIPYIIAYTGFLVVMIIALSTNNISFIGEVNEEFNSTHSNFSKIFIYTAIFTFIIAGTAFSVRCIKSEHEETRLKGWFLEFAWILFTVGAILDSTISQLQGLLLILIRLILVLGAIFYYIGWFLPKKISHVFLKKPVI
ncbi:MAG: hypothetical protein JW891_07245 [Candidatus Lokiarchaeota archaeon]|nr:hypothetical protein [Candidatus Lokiarchaeota archaeon]